MNNKYYGEVPSYNNTSFQNQTMPLNYDNVMNAQPLYIGNILGMNRGKKATINLSIPGNDDWQNEAINGIIEQSGVDHIILSDPSTGNWYLLPMMYINYIKFDEEINTI